MPPKRSAKAANLEFGGVSSPLSRSHSTSLSSPTAINASPFRRDSQIVILRLPSSALRQFPFADGDTSFRPGHSRSRDGLRSDVPERVDPLAPALSASGPVTDHSNAHGSSPTSALTHPAVPPGRPKGRTQSSSAGRLGEIPPGAPPSTTPSNTTDTANPIITPPAAPPGPRPRGRPVGVKKKAKLADPSLTTDLASLNSTSLSALQPQSQHHLPHQHQHQHHAHSSASAAFRALDRSGKPCRRWEKRELSLRSFTGVAWNVVTWRTKKKVGEQRGGASDGGGPAGRGGNGDGGKPLEESDPSVMSTPGDANSVGVAKPVIAANTILSVTA